MTDIRIEHLDRDRLGAARKLVWRVFPRQNPFERLSFWAIANRNCPLMRGMMAFVGVILGMAEFGPAARAEDGRGVRPALRRRC